MRFPQRPLWREMEGKKEKGQEEMVTRDVWVVKSPELGTLMRVEKDSPIQGPCSGQHVMRG